MAPPFGYNVNPSKTWLVVKPDYIEEAVSAFSNTNIRITCDGRPYLGSALGSQKYTEEFVNSKVKQWITELGEKPIKYRHVPTPCCFYSIHSRLRK